MVTKKPAKSPKQIVLKAHHRRAYRKRHLSSLAISVVAIGVLGLQTGMLIGRGQSTPAPVATAAAPAAASSVTNVRSSYGYSFAADSNQFVISATQLDDKGIARQVSADQLHNKTGLVSATIKPRSGSVKPADAAAQLTFQVNPDAASLSTLQARPENAGVASAQVAAGLFPITGNTNVDVRVLSNKADTLSGVAVYKTVYEYTPKFEGGNSYAVVWTGVSQGRAFAVKLQGLVGASTVPEAFSAIFESLRIDSDQKVKGASTDIFTPSAAANAAKLDPKYLSDALSPAVVKIYHIVCGALSIDGLPLTSDACTGFTGSGFMTTSNGYIATNGHVVVYGAQNALVDILTSNPSAMTAFLRGIGLSGNQIQSLNNDPASLASIISKIYDIPDSRISFANKKDVTLVALGNTAPSFAQLGTTTDISRYLKDSEDLKVAQVIATNYTAKDSLTTIANPLEGFSSSDVALLKINVQNAPTIAISRGQVIQSQKLFLLGFPGDADNQLTDNRQLSVSTTEGVVSSIRQAAGGKGRLYQSDADASHGNSGGPAVAEDGTVIGLLTYRASGDAQGNAAKSYIRDITDFTDLAASRDVVINSTSATQQLWQKGLQLYGSNHFSAALKNFNEVKASFPAHRLVDTYIDSANTAIKQGSDVTLVPVGWVVAGMIAAFGAAAVSVVLIVRHHGRHKLYQVYQQDVQFANAKVAPVH
ncbi:MAG: hypothetical protein JWO35_351 [Candidatus Saccharibacteria bacterium]|nr:hypothetical protein [Candidatus Saccharibacteria bacterium]